MNSPVGRSGRSAGSGGAAAPPYHQITPSNRHSPRSTWSIFDRINKMNTIKNPVNPAHPANPVILSKTILRQTPRAGFRPTEANEDSEESQAVPELCFICCLLWKKSWQPRFPTPLSKTEGLGVAGGFQRMFCLKSNSSRWHVGMSFASNSPSNGVFKNSL
jgi:hypothetical protein